MIQYDMNDYDEIMNAGFLCNLTQETLDIISKLSEQVGAPTYIKTPIFLKKESRVMGMGSATHAMPNLGGGNGIGGFKKGKNRPSEITDEDWETIRQFQTTTKHVSEGIQKNMENIRGYLNKMSEATFDKMVNEIKTEISQLIKHETSDENMMKILEIIKNLQKLIMKYITKPDKTNEVEELNENLYIIITNSLREIKFGIDDGTENIIKCIEFISILKPKMKEYPSITNKTIFKHMDIITELK